MKKQSYFTVTQCLIRKTRQVIDKIQSQRENIEAMALKEDDIEDLQKRKYDACLYSIIYVENINNINLIMLTFLGYILKIDNL